MEIRHEAAPDLLRSVVRPPDLRPRKEESLVLRESVDRRNRGLPRFRLLQRSEGNRKAAKIGNVFSQGQLAVHVHRIDTDILIELLAKTLCTLRKRLPVRCRPPLPEVSPCVELTPLIVKSVRHLVADHRADAAVIHRIVRLRIEERGLQNPRGEDNLIHQWVIVSVHGGRCHPPLRPVNRLSDVVKLALELERACTHEVCNERSPVDRESAVILPLVRISDLDFERIELGQRKRFCRIAHPVACLDPRAECLTQVLHHRFGPCFCLRREVLLDVFDSDKFAQGAVGEVQRSLPPRLDLLRTRKNILVEPETLHHKRRA